MTGVSESQGGNHSAGHTAADWAPTQGDVAGLIRALCSQGLRRGVRVVGEDKRGHIFFDQGHVVHAEFGEDVGLGAVIEMLHSGSVEFRPCARPWPSQPSLFFTAEKLLAAARPGAMNALTGVRRKPDAEAPSPDSASGPETPSFYDPPPLPDAELEPTRADHSRAEAARPEPTLAAQFAPLDAAVSELSRAVAAAAHRSTAARASRVASTRALRARVPAVPPPAPSSKPTPAAAAPAAKPASAPASAPAPSSGASPVSPTSPSAAPSNAASPAAAGAQPSASTATASLATGGEREHNAPPRQRALPVTWTRRALPRLMAESDEPPTSRRRLELATSMVRVSGRGVLLAARGEECERLANAAAFIHNQAKLIAADLGRHGRTAVHLKGGGLSLLVVKSEVNDIAAALGPTERLRSLLRKVGLG